MNGSEQPACRRSNLETLLRLLNSQRTEVPLAKLLRLLRLHPPGLEEVREHVRFDPRGYTRNLVGETGCYRALVLCWLPGQLSPIHDHCASACAVLIISGTAAETRYALTSEGLARPTRTLVYGPGAVFGGQDADIHALGNGHEQRAGLITCNIYSPPLTRMNLYEPETAHRVLDVAGHA